MLSPVCRVFTIYLKQTIFLGNILVVLQLFFIYNLCYVWCYLVREILSYFYISTSPIVNAVINFIIIIIIIIARIVRKMLEYIAWNSCWD
jgi:hypothetical protein